MKNIHIIPTSQPSRLVKAILSENLLLADLPSTNKHYTKYNIYITSDELIKEGDWCLDKFNQRWKLEDKKLISFDSKGIKRFSTDNILGHECKKIILTTDQDLIKNDVQAIDDEFLEWFVKNTSCEEVEVESFCKNGDDCPSQGAYDKQHLCNVGYEIIIPKEEPKQLFTDHPITELGDEEFKEAPIRQCELISYDDNKYCYVKVEGIEKEIKRCYIYSQKGRCGEVDCISVDEIKELLKEEPKQEYEYIGECKGNNDDGCFMNSSGHNCGCYTRKPIKQETLEEAAIENNKHNWKDTISAFISGAKWQEERMYSEEEVENILIEYVKTNPTKPYRVISWFTQFKKK